jgi:hypothetical protein
MHFLSCDNYPATGGEQFNEKVSIKRVRELRITILNELFQGQDGFVTVTGEDNIFKEQVKSFDAKT